MKQKTIQGQFVAIIAMCLCGIGLTTSVFASRSDGTIEPLHRYAWSENVGWLDFGSAQSNVHVTDSVLTGYVWGENIGWISLSCVNDDSCSAVEYRVHNDDKGILSGRAYGENIGWIDFAPDNGGVTIDDDGIFMGTAWGENTGWITFNCATTDSCTLTRYDVATDWRPKEVRKALDVYDVRYKTTNTTITIKWRTNKEADSRVRFGKDESLIQEKKDKKREENHKIKIKKLLPDTQYYFRVKSVSANSDADRSRIYTAKTDTAGIVHAIVASPWRMAQESEQEYVKIIVFDDDNYLQEEREWEDANTDEWSKTIHKEGENVSTKITKKVSVFFEGAMTRTEYLRRAIADAVGRFRIDEDVHLVKRFATRVFERDNTTYLANVQFQIYNNERLPANGIETTLFSDPQTTVTDSHGIATFHDVPVGQHTLAFDIDGKKHRKGVNIGQTATTDGIVHAEIVQIHTATNMPVWAWFVIILASIFFIAMLYFGMKYYSLKKQVRAK